MQTTGANVDIHKEYIHFSSELNRLGVEISTIYHLVDKLDCGFVGLSGTIYDAVFPLENDNLPSVDMLPSKLRFALLSAGFTRLVWPPQETLFGF